MANLCMSRGCLVWREARSNPWVGGHGNGPMYAGAPTQPAFTPNLIGKRKNRLLEIRCIGFESV